MPLLTPNGKRDHLRLLLIEPFRIVMVDTNRDSFRVLQISGSPEEAVISFEIRGAKDIAIRFVRELLPERFIDRDEQKAQADRLARQREKLARFERK